MARQRINLVSVDCEVVYDKEDGTWSISIEDRMIFKRKRRPQKRHLLRTLFNEQSVLHVLTVVDAEAVAKGFRPSLRYRRIRKNQR